MFSVTFSADKDKLGPEGVVAGDLSIRYSTPSRHPDDPDYAPLGAWHYQGRYEASDASALTEICSQFEEWKAKRLIEIGIEASLKSALAPLCPCHEPDEDDQPEDEPTTE